MTTEEKRLAIIAHNVAYRSTPANAEAQEKYSKLSQAISASTLGCLARTTRRFVDAIFTKITGLPIPTDSYNGLIARKVSANPGQSSYFLKLSSRGDYSTYYPSMKIAESNGVGPLAGRFRPATDDEISAFLAKAPDLSIDRMYKVINP